MSDKHKLKLSATGLCRDYAGRRVVHPFDLNLASGEILGLLGPNGAGKTTTLRMLAGTLAPSAGQVWIAGHNLAEAPRQARAHLGYLPERPPVYGELTVDEYLWFCARLHDIPKAQQRDAIATARQDCGLEDVGRRLIGHLSKGFQQRVGIAQAIVHRPDVVILDEPTAGLDPNQLRGIRDLIRRLAVSHSVLISSHILPEVQAVASRVMILHEGRIALDTRLDALEDDSDTIRVVFQQGPDAKALSELAGVTDVAATGRDSWELRATAGDDIRGLIVRQAVACEWNLVEIARVSQSLEARFVALTGRDRPEAAA